MVPADGTEREVLAVMLKFLSLATLKFVISFFKSKVTLSATIAILPL